MSARRSVEAEPIVNYEGTPLVIVTSRDVRGQHRDYLAPHEARAHALALMQAADAAEAEAAIVRAALREVTP